jgi:hypothetical protein
MVCSSPFFLCLFVVSNIKKNLFWRVVDESRWDHHEFS